MKSRKVERLEIEGALARKITRIEEIMIFVEFRQQLDFLLGENQE